MLVGIGPLNLFEDTPSILSARTHDSACSVKAHTHGHTFTYFLVKTINLTQPSIKAPQQTNPIKLQAILYVECSFSKGLTSWGNERIAQTDDSVNTNEANARAKTT
jgi:hypothetical protein